MLAKKLFTSILSSVVLLTGSVYAQTVTESSFESDGDYQVHYVKSEVENAKGKVVISQGYTEHYIKWSEMISDLNTAGYSVYALDHRGQGKNERLGLPVGTIVGQNPDGSLQVEDGQTVHIDSFETYKKDLEEFVNKVVGKNPADNMILLGHSMGSTIANAYLLENEKVFDKAILLSPLYEPSIPDEAAAKLPGYADLMPLVGKVTAIEMISDGICEQGYCQVSPLMDSVFDENNMDIANLFQNNGGTLNFNIWYPYHLYRVQNVDTVTTRPSFGWISAAIKEGKRLQNVEVAKKLETPTLMMGTLPQTDFFVNASLHAEVCLDKMETCEYFNAGFIPTDNGIPSFHELYRERPEIRSVVVNKILTFIE